MACFELLRRGYKVMIGKVGNTEVDFVAEREGAYTYFQVTADMTAEEIFEREMRPLTLIRDNYEKIVLTADHLTAGNYNGIYVKNLSDWLLGNDQSDTILLWKVLSQTRDRTFTLIPRFP